MNDLNILRFFLEYSCKVYKGRNTYLLIKMTTRKRRYGYGRTWKVLPRKKRRYVGSYIPRPIIIRAPGESKFFDSDKDDGVVAATGAITTSLNLVVQGIAESQRIGRKITITKIHCTFSVFLPAESDKADISTGDIVRVMLYCDKQANGADANVTDLLETATFFSYRNLTNSKRFQILFDKYYTINRRVAMTDGTNTSASPRVEHSAQKVNRNLNIPIEFSANTGAITEITTNNIGLLYISKQGAAGIDTTCRIRYTG